MNLGVFELETLKSFQIADRKVYAEAKKNNQQLVIGDYKGNPKLIDARSVSFKKCSKKK